MFNLDLDPLVRKGTGVKRERLKGHTRRCGSVTSDHHGLAPDRVGGLAKSRRIRGEAPVQSVDQQSEKCRSPPPPRLPACWLARPMPAVGEEAVLNSHMHRNSGRETRCGLCVPLRPCGMASGMPVRLETSPASPRSRRERRCGGPRRSGVPRADRRAAGLMHTATWSQAMLLRQPG